MRNGFLAVDWNSYAAVYDLMSENNPAYQDLVKEFTATACRLRFDNGETLVDLGAGTGNFSIELARLQAHCDIVHIDNDGAMLAAAQLKAGARCITNMKFVFQDVTAVKFEHGAIGFVAAIHSLYALPNPNNILRVIWDWLRPGGYLFLCDPGRVLNVFDWSRYLIHEAYRRGGLIHALRLLWGGRVVAFQNARIRAAQRRGEYWIHSHQECRQSLEKVGFHILSSKLTYRGYSDLFVCQKP